jgi:hypothetical protein
VIRLKRLYTTGLNLNLKIWVNISWPKEQLRCWQMKKNSIAIRFKQRHLYSKCKISNHSLMTTLKAFVQGNLKGIDDLY